MQNLHLKLTSKYPRYNTWHQTKHHNKVHWGILIIGAVIIAGLIFWMQEDINILETNFNISEFKKSNKSESLINDKIIFQPGAYLDLIPVGLHQGEAPDVYEISAGQDFQIDIMLSTEQTAINKVDIILLYNPSIIEGKNIKTNDSVFNDFSIKNIDSKLGRIKISASNASSYGFDGTGKIASLIFKSLKNEVAEILFVFQPYVIDDTNTIEFGTGKDVLLRVKSIAIDIESPE